LDEDREVKE